ncbi:hypothetical protein D3C76_1419340 [compost metagenome]
MAQGFDAVHLRHVVVEQHQVRLQRLDHGQGFFAVVGFADDLEIVFQFKHLADATTHHGVVVDQKDAATRRAIHVTFPWGWRPRNSGRNSIWTRVPCGSLERICNWPCRLRERSSMMFRP